MRSLIMLSLGSGSILCFLVAAYRVASAYPEHASKLARRTLSWAGVVGLLVMQSSVLAVFPGRPIESIRLYGGFKVDAERASATDMRLVAPARYETKDPITGIPLTVTVDGFAIARTETTQGEFEKLMGRNPSIHRGAGLPVENVSWFDAIAFANALSKREKLTPCYDEDGHRRSACNGYRLPTEAEWQLANGNRWEGHLGADVFSDTKLLENRTTFPVDDRMAGNVWEWCEDWFAPEHSPWPVHNPRGPVRGFEKVIRGGSTVSRTFLSRRYRSGRDPEARSARTGFRLARSTGERSTIERAALPAPRTAAPPEHWRRMLGEIKAEKPKPETRLLRRIEESYFTAEVRMLRTESDAWEKIVVVYPDDEPATPRPVVIVPYYDVDTPVGVRLGGRNFQPESTLAFAALAAQQGWIAVAVRWFGESYGEKWDEAVANLRDRHPGATGMAKWIWDSQRVLDWVETQPAMDRERIAMMGHSLGGKMTLYAMAFDSRIRMGVVSEPGISLRFSNYDFYWYLGERINQLPSGADHHELLRAISPRPFHLIAGGDSDGDRSLAVLRKAKADGFDLSLTNHRSGHTPTPDSVGEALGRLRRYLGE